MTLQDADAASVVPHVPPVPGYAHLYMRTAPPMRFRSLSDEAYWPPFEIESVRSTDPPTATVPNKAVDLAKPKETLAKRPCRRPVAKPFES